MIEIGNFFPVASRALNGPVSEAVFELIFDTAVLQKDTRVLLEVLDRAAPVLAYKGDAAPASVLARKIWSHPALVELAAAEPYFFDARRLKCFHPEDLSGFGVSVLGMLLEGKALASGTPDPQTSIFIKDLLAAIVEQVSISAEAADALRPLMARLLRLDALRCLLERYSENTDELLSPLISRVEDLESWAREVFSEMNFASSARDRVIVNTLLKTDALPLKAWSFLKWDTHTRVIGVTDALAGKFLEYVALKLPQGPPREVFASLSRSWEGTVEELVETCLEV